jgi:hypothetical protein
VSVLGDGAPSPRVIAARITGDAREDAAVSGYQRRPPARRLTPGASRVTAFAAADSAPLARAEADESSRAAVAHGVQDMRGAQTAHAARAAPWVAEAVVAAPTARITASCPVMAERTVDATVTSPAATRKRGCRTVTASGLRAKPVTS